MADDKNMNPVFSIKNFRSFGEEGADFELAPITVLTGCNSAGKSSLVKALLLLSRYMTMVFPEKELNIESDYNCSDGGGRFPLQLSFKDLALGRYDKLVHEGSDGKIEMSYTMFSQYLQDYVRVKRIFSKRNKDFLNSGECVSYCVEKLDGTLVFGVGPHLFDHDEYASFGNLGAIEENYIRFENTCKTKSDDFKYQKAAKDGATQEELKALVEKYREFVRNNPTIGNLSVELMEMIDDWNDLWSNKDRYDKVKKNVCINQSDECGMDFIKRDTFANLVNNEVVSPVCFRNVNYIDSSSATIKRVYTTEDVDKMCLALRNLYDRVEKTRLETGLNMPYYFINRWIKRFGIGDKISIEGSEEGVGIMLYLIKDEKKRLLADEGYGVTQLVSLLLNIENQIPDDPSYLNAGFPPSYICVEEPENHLHPKYQSLLADMFVEAYREYNIHFIIETHSEYLIRKLQVMVADKENKLTSNEVSINYVDKDEDGISHNRQIKIQEDGFLSDSFGEGFFDEATERSLDLLRIQMDGK